MGVDRSVRTPARPVVWSPRPTHPGTRGRGSGRLASLLAAGVTVGVFTVTLVVLAAWLLPAPV